MTVVATNLCPATCPTGTGPALGLFQEGTTMTWIEMLTLGIAGWGAGLSTVLAVGEWRRRRPHLKVRLDLCEFTPLEGEPKTTAVVTVTNHGEKAVSLERIYFHRPKPRAAMEHVTTNGVTFPHTMEPGTKLVATYPGDALLRWIGESSRPEDKTLRAVCRDSLGRKYFSNNEDFGRLAKLPDTVGRSERGQLEAVKVKKEPPKLFWCIPCFDRRKEKPFPVCQKWYWLDWDELSPEDTEAVTAVLEDQKPKQAFAPNGLGESVTTFYFGHDGTDERWFHYRHLFKEVPENDFVALIPQHGQRTWDMVRVPGEYFEDETGSPITSYEMIQHVSGQEFPIILGDPNSIMRLGTVDPVNVGEWTEEKANTIAQFLDVVTRIWQSRWLHQRLSMSAKTDPLGAKELLEAVFPDDHDTMAVLAYFRQLHAGDKLLGNAVDAYVSHCGDRRKIDWVNERKHRFEVLVDSPPTFDTGGKTRREVLQMFMYGARLLHGGTPHQNADKRLEELISRLGKHETVMMFNMCLRDFYGVANNVYHVVRQDFQHWIDNCSLAAPTRSEITDLFAGYRMEDDRESK